MWEYEHSIETAASREAIYQLYSDADLPNTMAALARYALGS